MLKQLKVQFIRMIDMQDKVELLGKILKDIEEALIDPLRDPNRETCVESDPFST